MNRRSTGTPETGDQLTLIDEHSDVAVTTNPNRSDHFLIVVACRSPSLAHLLRQYATSFKQQPDRYRVLDVADEDGLLEVLEILVPDVVVVDLGLATGQPSTLIERLRAQAGCLLLTMSTDLDVDPDVLLPVSSSVLARHVDRVLEQREFQLEHIKKLGSLTINLTSRSAYYKDQILAITPTEFAILEHLLLHPTRLHTYQELASHVWPGNEPPPERQARVLSVHMRRLRLKVEPAPSEPRFLLTEHGRGFRLELSAEPASPKQFPGLLVGHER